MSPAELASCIFEDPRKTRVLCIGSGDPIERVAAGFRGAIDRRADPPDDLDRYDVVISCCRKAVPVIGVERVRHALRRRKRRPILFVDLGADIDRRVTRLEDVFLCTGEDEC